MGEKVKTKKKKYAKPVRIIAVILFILALIAFVAMWVYFFSLKNQANDMLDEYGIVKMDSYNYLTSEEEIDDYFNSMLLDDGVIIMPFVVCLPFLIPAIILNIVYSVINARKRKQEKAAANEPEITKEE